MGIYVRSGQMRKNQRNESNKVLKALAMANTQKQFTFHAASRTVMVKSNLNIDLSAYSIPDLAPCTPHASFIYPIPWLESMNSALAANGTELFSAIDESKQTKTQSPTHTHTHTNNFTPFARTSRIRKYVITFVCMSAQHHKIQICIDTDTDASAISCHWNYARRFKFNTSNVQSFFPFGNQVNAEQKNNN